MRPLSVLTAVANAAVPGLVAGRGHIIPIAPTLDHTPARTSHLRIIGSFLFVKFSLQTGLMELHVSTNAVCF